MTRSSFQTVIICILTLAIINGCSEDESPTIPNLSPPNTLNAEAISAEAIALNWDNDDLLGDGFLLERGSGMEWTRIAELDINTNTFSDFSLDEGTTYHYRLKTFDGDMESAPSNTTSATTLPATPSDLNAERLSTTSIALSWTNVSNVSTGLEIERKFGADTSYTPLEIAAADMEGIIDTDLTPRTEYYYRVRALHNEQSSEWSNVSSASTIVYIPEPPVEFMAEVISDTEINLTWEASQDPEPTGYTIEQSLTGEGAWSADNLDGDTYSLHVSNLHSSTTYYFRAIAFNDSGRSEYSDVISVQTAAGPPLAPDNLEGSADDYTQVTLSWHDNSDDEIGFYIQRKFVENDEYDISIQVASNVTNWTDLAVDQLTDYEYRLSSFNDFGASEWTSSIIVSVPLGPPTPPANIEAITLSSSEIRLSWEQQYPEPSSYIIEQSLTGNDGWDAEVIDGNTLFYIASELHYSTTYYFRAFAVNDSGRSEYSEIISAQTDDTPPQAPDNLDGSAVDHEAVVLTWRDNSDNEDGFYIQRKLAESNEWDESIQVASNETSWTDNAIFPAFVYDYQISSYNDVGSSDWTATITITVPLALATPPVDFEATAVSDTEIRLTWSQPNFIPDGYFIEQSLTGDDDWLSDSVEGDQTFYPVTELEVFTTYYFRAYAYNDSGRS